MKKLFLLSALASSTAISSPRFDIKPAEGFVISIGCQSDDDDECSYDSFMLGDINNNRTINFSKKKSSWPGLEKAPKAILNTLSNAADALGDVTYVHVAITYRSVTYEYSFDRTTGWNSFRAIQNQDKCTLKCMPKLPSNDSSQN